MIPALNFNRLHTPATLLQLDNACQTSGAFYLVNHGIPALLEQSLFQQMRLLFALPLEQKMALQRSELNPWGYFGRELTKNQYDAKEVFDICLNHEGGEAVPWPKTLADFKTVFFSYFEMCQHLSEEILLAIVQNLGNSGADIIPSFKKQATSFLRLNHYPVNTAANSCGQTSEQFGVHEHTDAGALTILNMDEQPGLEVYCDGSWQRVKKHENALLVNIGDIVQVWSNDKYQAALHRVKKSEQRSRYSLPFFLNPSYDTNYQPLFSMVDASNPARYHNINWGQFRARRAQGDYADHGHEVQISDYRAVES